MNEQADQYRSILVGMNRALNRSVTRLSALTSGAFFESFNEVNLTLKKFENAFPGLAEGLKEKLETSIAQIDQLKTQLGSEGFLPESDLEKLAKTIELIRDTISSSVADEIIRAEKIKVKSQPKPEPEVKVEQEEAKVEPKGIPKPKPATDVSKVVEDFLKSRSTNTVDKNSQILDSIQSGLSSSFAGMSAEQSSFVWPSNAAKGINAAKQSLGKAYGEDSELLYPGGRSAYQSFLAQKAAGDVGGFTPEGQDIRRKKPEPAKRTILEGFTESVADEAKPDKQQSSLPVIYAQIEEGLNEARNLPALSAKIEEGLKDASNLPDVLRRIIVDLEDIKFADFEVEGPKMIGAGGAGGGGDDGDATGAGGRGDDRGKGKQKEPLDKNLLVYFLQELKGIIQVIGNIASEFQNTALSFGFEEPIQVLNNSISNQIPAATELKTSTIALRTGLEKNTKGVLNQLARSELLGEDTAGLAASIQSLKTVMNLSVAETDSFTQSVANSARTYNTSTTALMKSIAQFAESIKSTMLGAGGAANIEAFKQIEARVQRLLPQGSLQRATTPLFTGNLESVGAAGLLNIQEELAIIRGTGFTADEKAEAAAQALENAAATASEYVNTFGDIGIAESALGGALAPFGGLGNIAEMQRVADALRGIDTRPEEQARLEDAIQSINALGQRLLEPLALMSESLISMLGWLGDLSSYVVNGLLITAFASVFRVINTAVTRIPNLLQNSNITLKSILATLRGTQIQNSAMGLGGGKGKGFLTKATQQTRIARRQVGRALAGGAGRMAATRALGGMVARGVGAVLGGPVGVIIGLLSFLPAILSSGEDTEKNTDEIKKNTKKDLQNIESRSQDVLNKQASFLAELSQQTIRAQILISKTDSDDTANLLAEQRLQRLGDIVDGVNKLSAMRTKTPDILEQTRR